MPRGAVGSVNQAPKYQQLQSHLRDLIESGQMRPGDVFPSEADLIKGHGLSRITVRRAISELERELSARVYLNLNVRVRPRWRRDDGLLDRLGIE